MNAVKRWTRYFSSFVLGLQPRERMLFALAVMGIIFYGTYIIEEDINISIKTKESVIKRRSQELLELNNLLKRYAQLSQRFKQVQTTFTKSQMTFEQVTADLDKLVRESIGSSTYDLNKTKTPTDIGLEFEKQEFTVKLKSLSLEQIVSLLHKLETGGSPLFLGKLDITKAITTGDFSANIEVFSIRRKS